MKDAPPDEFVRAVKLLAAGEALLAPSVTRRLLDLRGKTLEPVLPWARDEAVGGLTARERTVLGYVARAMSNGDIAVAMDLAPSSVKTHVGHLLAKLGFTDRAQLVVFAYEHGLVRPGADRSPSDDDGGRPNAGGAQFRRPWYG